jgi:prephenate dehydratase/prephenate dehydrogenase
MGTCATTRGQTSLSLLSILAVLVLSSTCVGAGGLWNDLSDPTPRVTTSLPRTGRASTTAAAASDLLRQSRGGSTTNPSSSVPIRVAYQGEPGAYSEKSTRELLGEKVVAVGRPNFEACFQAVASMECDYACLPVENSLGGSIHENYDLMLRYDLKIVAEHEFRVKHCLLAKRGVARADIKYAISHPQALAQCDNFLRGLGITPVPTYDTAGSAKMISEGAKLPPNCTPENTAAIASDLAGRTYGLNALDAGIEDDDTNFTRFLLLARKDVTQHLTQKIPAKTSIVFTLPNTPGALYKCLACFSLRDIDFSKIESRPTSASLLNFLKFKSQQLGKQSRNRAELPRFRYCFYLDFLASPLDENTQNALAHLREQADFVRVLGSYPQKSRLVGPVAQSVEDLKHLKVDPKEMSLSSLPSDNEEQVKPLRIGIVGFDRKGQFLALHFSQKHRVSCLGTRQDFSLEAKKIGVEYFSNFEISRFLSDLDVVVLAVPLTEFRDAVSSLPPGDLKGKLVVETCVLNSHPKSVMLEAFGKHPDIDILSTHPMISAVLAEKSDQNPYVSASWDGRPIVYEKVRVADEFRCEKFLRIFQEARCQMVEMSAEQHDASVADAEFVTHLTGRLLVDKQLLPPTPVVSKEYAALCDVADMTAGESFDLFFGMFRYNPKAKDHLNKMRDNLAAIERRLAAKEAVDQYQRNARVDQRAAMHYLAALNGNLFDSMVKPENGESESKTKK